MATNQSEHEGFREIKYEDSRQALVEKRQIEIFRGLSQERYEDLKKSDPQEAERYAGNKIQVYLKGSDWPLLEGRKSREAATVSLGMDGVRKEWNHYRELLEERGLDAWPLLEQQRDYFEEQIGQAEEELEQIPPVFPKDPAATLEEKAAKEIRQVVVHARMLFQRKLHVLRKVMRQWALTRHVPELTTEEVQSMAGATPHRREQADKICIALSRHLKEHDGEYPYSDRGEPFRGSLELLYEWGTDFIEANGKKTVYRALRRTHLLPLGNQGDSTQLLDCLTAMKARAEDIQ
jgi:hypothetical protein